MTKKQSAQSANAGAAALYRRSSSQRPSKIAAIAFSIRAVRVADSMRPAY
jgi:hypothetical protein